MSTLTPVHAGSTRLETDPDEIESCKGMMDRKETAKSPSQGGSASLTDDSMSDRAAIINHSEAANPRTPIIAENHSPQSGGLPQHSSPVLTMECYETNITTDQNDANAGDTLNRVRQDLREGRFEIPPFKIREFDVTTQAGTRQFSSLPEQLYLSPLRRRFDLSHLLPDRNLPFNGQIMEHVKSWAELGSRIEDDTRRKEVLDHVFEVLQKAWFEALRLGYDPGMPISNSGKRRQRMPTAPSAVKRQPNLDQLPPLARQRQKKDVEPSKLPIFVSGSYKNSQLWGVTAGELEQAGISESRVRERAATDLSAGDALLQEVLDDLNTEEISKPDWLRTEEITPLNPLGRDILLYSLFEVQMSRRSLNHLEGLYVRFTTKQQKVNTQKRIDDETKRHNLFLALALEVNDQAETSSLMSLERRDEGELCLSRQFPDTGNEGSGVESPLFDFMERIVAVANMGDLRQLVSSGSLVLPEHISDTNSLFADTPSDEENARHVSREILQNVQSVNSLFTDVERAAGNAEKHLLLQTEIGELEKRIADNKSLLADLLSSLKHQLLNASKENDSRGDIEMESLQDNTENLKLGECATTRKDISKVSHETKSSFSASTNSKDAEDVDASQPEYPQTPQAKYDHAVTMETCSPFAPPLGSSDENIPNASRSSYEDGKVQETCSGSAGEEDGDPVQGLEEQVRCQSLVVNLRAPKGFDPDELTSEKVFNHMGFSYRYTRTSSLAERREMDECLDSYVRQTRKGPVPNFRFRRYEALCHPADPLRKTIIHGIWDNRDGSKAEGAEWFYDGDGDCQPPAIEYDHKPWMELWKEGTTGGGEGNSDAKVHQAPEPEQPQTVNKNFKNVLKIKLKTRPDANIGKRRKMQPKRQSRKGPPSASPLSQSVTASTTKGQKRARSASAGRPRPKRQAGKQIKYTEFDGDDDEFVPSD
ncbi:hypothetical protein RBB50_002979 [Rhinocladiella similis]